MPGVKMVEALAQAGAVAVLAWRRTAARSRSSPASTASASSGRAARGPLTLECELEAVRGPIGRGKARATVDGELAVRGTLTFAVDQAS